MLLWQSVLFPLAAWYYCLLPTAGNRKSWGFGLMCQPDGHNDDGAQRPPRPSPAAFVANQRDTGLPWHRVAALVAANSWRKIRTGRNCCGNLGQPGC